MNNTEDCAGYVELMFFASKNEIFRIGYVGFDTPEELDSQWEAIQDLSGGSSFVAYLTDLVGDTIDDKFVTTVTCEALMGRPIEQLIAEGRANLRTALDFDSE